MLEHVVTVVISIISVIVAFVAGWFTATGRIREEVYCRRLDIYQQLNKYASDLVFNSIEAKADPGRTEKMIETRLEYS